MKIYRLTREERIEIHQAVVAAGLEPLDFQWSESDKHLSEHVQLLHKPTDYAIRFSAYTNQHERLEYTASWVPAIERMTTTTFHDIDKRLGFTKIWLDVVKREHDLPDLWAAAQEQRDLIVGDVLEDDRRFTKHEQKRVAEQLLEVEAFLRKVRPMTTEEAQWLHVRIEYVAEASERMTLKDWKNQLVSFLFQAWMALALDQNTARELFALTGRLIGPILGAIRGLLS